MNALIAVLAFLEEQEVAAIFDEPIKFAVVGILRLLAVEDQITVFQTVAVVDVLAIDVFTEGEDAHFRKCLPHVVKLLEERTIEIIGASKRKHIPPITVPACRAVHGRFFIRGIHRDHGLLAHVAVP